mmetsp:Transcript_36649/g.72062  ORF Transcript_36649/g.72062 Transcript_36649/m.72062 type:complete len:225 (-) Transcript_36649:359-1033(-)
MEAKRLTEVDEIENVFLKAGSTKSDRRLEEFRSNTRVHSNSSANLTYVSARGLAEGRDRINARDTLCEECIGNELGALRTPEIGGDHPFLGNKSGVNVHKRLDGGKALGSLLSANQDTRRVLEVVNGRTLRKKFRVGQNLKLQSFFIAREDPTDGVGGTHGHRALLDNYLTTCHNLGNIPRRELAILNVGRPPRANSLGLGGSVHADEDYVREFDFDVDIGAEE